MLRPFWHIVAKPQTSGIWTNAVKHVLFVQNGDFREAHNRFANGGVETYRDQRRSVDFAANLAPESQATVVAFGPQHYDETLAPGLRAIGLPRAAATKEKISALFDTLTPSHVVLRTPHLDFLREVRRRRTWLLPIFADIFERGDFKTSLKYAFFRHVLMRCKAPCVSNHSLNASNSMVTGLRIPANRVVPWDWSKVPLAGPPKTGVYDPAAPRAFFAGVLSEPKGVGDCLEAIALTRQNGLKLEMSFAGPGDTAPWEAKAKTLGIEDHVRFLGMIPNAQVRTEMHAADFVVVPSRHSYGEGLPNTIYEGLASRSVLIISDHPAFMGRLQPEDEALIFKASNPGSLAQCFQRAAKDASLYARLSKASDRAHDALYVGMEWTALVQQFLDDPQNLTGWVAANSLQQYESPSPPINTI